MTVHPSLQPYIDAWTHSIEAISELVTPLTEGEWSRPTDLPGWSVRDVVSHIIGVECEMLGDPRPIHTLPRDLFHVRTDFARRMELQVDVRRHHTGPEMTAELEYTVIRRARSLRNETRSPETVLRGPLGEERSLQFLLRQRAFDVWVHEQDLRRALNAPGNLDSPGAQITRDLLLLALPKVVAKDAGAPAGSSVVVDVGGPVEFMRTVRVDAQGVGTVDASVPLGPAVTLSMDWEVYMRLACGRVRPAAVAEQIKIDGDRALADSILGNFAITP
ncbi:maleylpyruvate isomerase family mycothiol-dependent enzyme [Streptomyces sp. MST-110588]|uniref:maleylpyruvate isomerase family mycothiol-dependent enzyme n=1 Tax=Streptomyces sp. MST-110588 TaxID=2833628 RepID=UPI001F5CB4D4|nr:maleylpyruvate isomerase family mycothiol-dependent enzyme [Streptomyces sp. MST-110588]UNO41041.1 maleylpyruvate isomerase family mycothiol-dependent enzyme [Streptomyces sp. MST-110588]